MSDQPRDPTARFSDRVADYIRYRPGYPDEIVAALELETGIAPGAMVADVGSGTGISTELFLRHGYEVYSVEPNREMREAAEEVLGPQPGFHSVEGRAEATTLPDSWVDMVVAGQSFHWFDCNGARRELTRIMKSAECYVALFWNMRQTDSTPFLAGYEALLLEHGTDYEQVDHRNIGDERLRAFFGGNYEKRVFPNDQAFDFDGLRGRLLSSSYTPAAEDPRREPMLRALRELFEKHEENGRVTFLYDTELYFGQIV
jgi:SAM-dependent methyltransferase